MSSASPSPNDCIIQIHKILSCIKSSGTKVSIAWIPRHIGIKRNEKADNLTNAERTSPSGLRINHSLSSSKAYSIVKSTWTKNYPLSAKSSCQKECVTFRTNLNHTPWLFHSNRRVSICLHRLRTGHNYINSFAYRMDHEADPSCMFGCKAIENSFHLLRRSRPKSHTLPLFLRKQSPKIRPLHTPRL